MSYAVRRLFVLSALTSAALLASTAAAVAVSVPGVPTNVSASSAVRQATIHWSPPASNGGAAVDSYKITIAGDSISPPFSSSLAAKSGVTDYFFTFTGLKDHTAYTLSVAAHNSAGYGPAVSKSVTTPYATAVTLTATTPINYGRSSTLNAHLSNVDTNSAISGATLQLMRRDHGTTTWTSAGSTTTNSAGNASFVVTPTRNEDYRVSFARTGSLGASNATVTVNVRYVVTLHVSNSSPAVNSTDTLSGTVAPSAAGQTVVVQQYKSGAWQSLVTLTLNSNSAYSVGIIPKTTGTYTFRVVKAASASNAAGSSPTVTFTAH